MKIRLVYCCLLVLFMLCGAVVSAQDAPPLIIGDLRAALDAIDDAAPASQQAMVDDLWDALIAAGRVPYVDYNRVMFMYRGEAEVVDWRGDFTNWEHVPELLGRQIGGTDLWVAETALPVNARIEYKIVLDDNAWILDPANPAQAASGFGPNSELRMPYFATTDVSADREGIANGVTSDLLRFDSAALGYTVGYWVYTPAGYDALDDLPVVYVLDGNDFGDPGMGRIVPVLDSLIADGRIVPVIAVLISARDPDVPANNRREDEFLGNREYFKFVAEELVPEIDAAYDSSPLKQNRAIVGTSYGGLASAYLGVLYPDVFDMVAMYSPALVLQDVFDTYEAAEVLPARYFIGTGYPGWDNFVPQDALDFIMAQGAQLMFIQSEEGHSWGMWRAMLDEMLIYFFGRRLSE
ncbi:MAG: esterase family protein [Chloroflexi bacterium]|nr:esterase family protein [Chloroflexota bacterium]